jgi:cell division protein FtsB
MAEAGPTKSKRVWVFLAFVAVCLGGVYALTWAVGRQQLASARESYQAGRARLGAAQAQQRALEARLAALRTQTDFVELGARQEYRLIRPGERLEVIHLVGGAPATDSPPSPDMELAER